MIDSFKSYINTLLCLGIFMTILQLIMPKNHLRKYIYSLMGILMILTVISPVIHFLKNENMENGIQEVLANFDNYEQGEEKEYDLSTEDLVKEQMIENIKTSIIQKLEAKGIQTKEVLVYLEENYDVKKVSVTIKNLNQSDLLFQNLNHIVQYIHEEYEIDYSKIEVVEEGK